MSAAQALRETLDALKKAQGSPMDLAKASTYVQPGSATSGINFYDLEEGAKLLYPVLTPLRNEIPRTSGKGGIQANWRGVIAINPQQVSAGVSSGNRGGMIAVTTQDYTAAYRGLGLEAAVDFEADYAAQNFDDVKALAAKQLLESVMIQEEQIILGGNSSLALGTTGTPAITGAGTGGALPAATYDVICVGLTLQGYLSASVAGGIAGQITRSNTDGSTDVFGGGCAQKSAASATYAATGTTSSIAASVATMTGAVAYAWYWGTVGNELLGAITTTNSLTITAAATGTQLASAIPNGTADNSKNTLVFDGLLSLAFNPANNAQVYTCGGNNNATLTADGAGGIVEFDVVLKAFWDLYRLSPTKIYVNSQEQQNVSKKILQGGTQAAQRFVFTVDQGKIGGGYLVTSYRNKFTMNGAQEIPIELHPNMPAGTILFFTNKLPYPMSNVSNVAQIRARREYYQIEWPLRTRRYEYGVYADEVLQHYFTPSLGLITNIANG
jgi:hypothetical protein